MLTKDSCYCFSQCELTRDNVEEGGEEGGLQLQDNSGCQMFLSLS